MDGETEGERKEEKSGAAIGLLDELLGAVQGEAARGGDAAAGGGDVAEEEGSDLADEALEFDDALDDDSHDGGASDLLDTVQRDADDAPPLHVTLDEDESAVESFQAVTHDAAATEDSGEELEESRDNDAAEPMLVPPDTAGGMPEEESALASQEGEATALDAVDSTEAPAADSIVQEEQLASQAPAASKEPPAFMDKAPELPVLPPPAPMGLAVVVGSMVPASAGDDEDDDSDSQDEDDDEHPVLSPPLILGDLSDDEDDDQLEVDPAIAGTIEAQPASATPANVAGLHETKESDLLAALPIPKPTAAAAASSDEIEFSFADEVRAARVVVSPSSVEEPSKRGSKASGPLDDSVESAFGISYTSLRKKRGEGDSIDPDGYSLPSASAFPDEREFESELSLSTDVSLSVKAMAHSATLADATNDDDDDEFGPVASLSTAAGAAIEPVSPRSFETRQASLQARRAQDEEYIIEELKKATDEEKSLNETDQQLGGAAAPATAPLVAQAVESGNALTLRELHGIYKRGLGDQGVLLDENEDNDSKRSRAPHAAASSDPTPLSVMGRILSKPSMVAEAITEEDGDDDEGGGDTEERGGATASKKSDGATSQADERRSSHSTDGSQDWREIELTHHPQARDPVSRAEGGVTDSQSAQDSKPITTFKISFQEALDYCVQADAFLQHRDTIVPEDFGETGRSCFACFSPRPRLMFPGATEERDRVFCVAATGFDACSDVFARVLQTLYTKLTRTQREVPRSGSHWEDIGFQGNDPATDLRGCGVLSLLQMLFLVDKHAELALRFHSLSQHPTRHFPLACTLINVTLQCVIALRSGALYKECNRQSSVFGAVNSFYVALAAELMDEIQSSPDAIPIIMKDVLDDGRANPDRVLEQFAKAHEAGAQAPASPRKPRETSPEIAFTEIALQSPSSDEDDA